jgi:hypothetical protein
MIASQGMKVVQLIAPGFATSATNASHYGYLDTLGWDHATILVELGTGATNVKQFNLLEITEGTNSTAATAITALTGADSTSTAAGFAWTALAATPTCTRFELDLTKRERYLRLQANLGAACPPWRFSAAATSSLRKPAIR